MPLFFTTFSLYYKPYWKIKFKHPILSLPTWNLGPNKGLTLPVSIKKLPLWTNIFLTRKKVWNWSRKWFKKPEKNLKWVLATFSYVMATPVLFWPSLYISSRTLPHNPHGISFGLPCFYPNPSSISKTRSVNHTPYPTPTKC